MPRDICPRKTSRNGATKHAKNCQDVRGRRHFKEKDICTEREDIAASPLLLYDDTNRPGKGGKLSFALPLKSEREPGHPELLPGGGTPWQEQVLSCLSGGLRDTQGITCTFSTAARVSSPGQKSSRSKPGSGSNRDYGSSTSLYHRRASQNAPAAIVDRGA